MAPRCAVVENITCSADVEVLDVAIAVYLNSSEGDDGEIELAYCVRLPRDNIFVKHNSPLANSPLGDTNRTFVVYKQKPTDFQCDHLLTATQTNTKLRVAKQWQS